MSKPRPQSSSIELLTKRIRSLGRLPFKVKDIDTPGPENSYLCDVCSRISFEIEHFIVRPGEDENALSKKVPRYLGRLSIIRQKRFCPFCRLVLEIADRPADQRTPSSFALDDPTIYARWVVDGQVDQGTTSPTTGQPQFIPRTRRALIYSEPQAFKDGYIALLSESAPFKEFFGRRLKHQDQLDIQVIKSWIATCEHSHGPECDESLVHPDLMRERKNILRMIDVDAMCVTVVPQDCRFVALSYLWGKNFQQLFTTSENLPRLSVPDALSKEVLPQTIKDAIRLTRLLGEKYLWTDSLALVHDAGFQYHDDWIYARAHLTVVAGSGKDANAGLPGVRKDSRTWHQTIEEVKPGIKLVVTHLAEDYISTSQWDSRAWTFQERMLSRRCLLFVNGRVYFQCRKTTYCEDIEMPEVNGWSLDSIDMPTRIFKERPFIQFTSAVELYTRRDLTNPGDILDAFGGVQQVLEKRLKETVYFGLMESMMNSSLIWESSKRLDRRVGFPSWSWAGWTGEIQWKFAITARSWIDWHQADCEAGAHHFPPQDYPRIEPPIPWTQHRRRVVKKAGTLAIPLLHFDTIEASFNLHESMDIHKAMVSPLRKRLTGPSALSTVRPAPADPGLVRVAITDRDGEWCGTIDLDEKYEAQSNAHRPFQFLVMSRMPGFTEEEAAFWEGRVPDSVEDTMRRVDYGVYNVILIEERKGIYYREGLGRILADSLHNARGPGPVWSNVLLG